MTRLTELVAGQPIVYGGDRVTFVAPELAAAFRAGDRLVVVQTDGTLLHIPAADHEVVDGAVTAAVRGFAGLADVSDDAISAFFDRFADRLDDDDAFGPIAEANAADVDAAGARGRSTTRLVLNGRMRADMIAGLRGWRDSPSRRDVVVNTVEHAGWSVEARRAPLGVVGFVFEGRPNVFADACGVVRTGNAAVFRIGSDALGTARAIMTHALAPSLVDAGLPDGVVSLIDAAARSAGHALFTDRRLALAVARGSGAAVAQLGAVAAQSGVPVSLHGTGGAWVITGEAADPAELASIVQHSLDRKVCNTLNVCAVLRHRAGELIPAFLHGVDAAAAGRSTSARVHVVEGSEQLVPRQLFERRVQVHRADGLHDEPYASSIGADRLAHEWEWEAAPEVTLVTVDDVAEAVELFNTHSPHFTASLVSTDGAEHDAFYAAVDAPFVGNGFTRWVDGQYALDAPELGLSNWQGGRLLGRGGILSGDSVHTIRYRAQIRDHDTHR